MKINLCLRVTAFAGFLLLFAAVHTPTRPAAQPAPRAMPVTPVEEEKLPVLGKAPVVVELFSSQACVFCPRADQLFSDIIRQENVIGLACHVDYFDVRQGALSQEFCTARQTWYMQKLFAGPNYTPQMVINGVDDVVAYKFEAVVAALRGASISDVEKLDVAATGTAGTYKIAPPLARLKEGTSYKIWLALYDRPHEIVIAEGMNRGKKATYYNIVSQLGGTDNIEETVYVTPPLKPGHGGFAVILQDMDSGAIIAAGEYKMKVPD